MSDEEDFFEFGAVVPCRFEPECTEEELANHARESQVRDDEVEEPQPAPRTGQDWWCGCGKCTPMPTEKECLCCQEWDLLIPILEEVEQAQQTDEENDIQISCVTDHHDFWAHTVPGVLDTFFRMKRINWKKHSTPDGPNGTLSQV